MFTPVETTMGALLIQFATSSYLLTEGKTIGFSSTIYNVVNHTTIHNLAVVTGLFLSALITVKVIPEFTPRYDATVSLVQYIIGGALTGAGTKLGGGCTSGHMINGLSRLRVRSIVATFIFVSLAILTTKLLDLGDDCGLNYCYEYDASFTTFNEAKNRLITILASGFLSSYVILPYITYRFSSKAPVLLHIINGLNAGVFFGLGLIIAGMAQPSKTLGFLSILNVKKFDPSLALIILFTIIPNIFIWNYWILTKKSPLGTQSFDLSVASGVSKRFLIGNAMFGLGWGSLGVCPGPGILGVAFNGVAGSTWVLSFLIFYKLASVL